MAERSVDCEILNISDVFTLKKFKTSPDVSALVTITKEGISISNPPKTAGNNSTPLKVFILSNDLVSFYIKDRNQIQVCCYPYERNIHKRDAAKRVHLSFGIYFSEDQLIELSSWTKALQQLMDVTISDSINNYSPENKLLVLINPQSGPGKSHEIFNKEVAPVLSEADIPFTVVITRHANHACEMMQTLQLSNYRAIMAIGGDGLLYEVYNGLSSRTDRLTALQMPICIVPGGSGNGLAKALASWRKETPAQTRNLHGLSLVSALNAVRGAPQPMDLIEIHTSDGRRRVSFLSFGIGIISDVDIGSEKLRMLGEMRFTLWSLAKLAKLPKYKAKVQFKRAILADRGEGVRRSTTLAGLSHDEKKTLSHDIKRSSSVECTNLNNEELEYGIDALSLDSSSSSKSPDVTASPHPEDDGSMRKVKIATRKGSYPHLLNKADLDTSRDSDDGGPLSKAVPEDWETVQGEFLLVNGVYQSHISTSCHMCPGATPDDGVIWLLIIPGDTTRKTLFKFLIDLETGRHVSTPGLQIIPTTEVRLTPLTDKGLLVVDGERVPYGALHARVQPGLARVLVR